MAPAVVCLAVLLGFLNQSHAFAPFICSESMSRHSPQRRKRLQVVQELVVPEIPPDIVHGVGTNMLIDVPDHYFLMQFTGLAILMNISKNIARVRREEIAWEQRLAEARRERLRNDPTLSEIDLLRKEAEMEWSAYDGGAAVHEKRKKRVQVMEREAYDDDDDDMEDRNYRMTEEEIDDFEMRYGIDYDPYYDDPYSEDELPEGKCTVDGTYGDRIYEDGEIFYKDEKSGLFYRQGCKPRNLSFWRQR